ncbi:MAG: hypothetical protein GF379_05100 [Candidatus Omnitrophica bacterium]|nr:hypothetical protein [Candidatus Omnitrophota bacterium]
MGFVKGKTSLSDKQKNNIENYIEEAKEALSLRGCALRLDNLDIKPPVIKSKDVIFKSISLSKALEGAEEMLIMGATAGGRICDYIEEDCRKGEVSRSVVFDAVASESVDSALDWIMDYFSYQLRRENKRFFPRRFSAGYGDFNLGSQKIIYDILKMDKIGVTINENFVLLPEKSVTAIIGISKADYG